jgi:hypothetical protein
MKGIFLEDSRRPTDSELQISIGLCENHRIRRRQATEDLMEALLNIPEFVFKD